VALAVGIAAGGGGGYAVFASSNQAGTAILLIPSAIFLLIEIQGTSLIRFSSGSNTVELERRRRTVERAVKEIAREEPERAAGILEGAQLAFPSLTGISSSAQLSLLAAQYELQVSDAIASLGYTVSGAPSLRSDIDLLVEDNEGRSLGVNVKYRRINNGRHRRWLQKDFLLSDRVNALLIVTNVTLNENAAAWAAQVSEDTPTKFITWRDEMDNQLLHNSLSELFSAQSIPSKLVIAGTSEQAT
jgi:hypothetical protein